MVDELGSLGQQHVRVDRQEADEVLRSGRAVSARRNDRRPMKSFCFDTIHSMPRSFGVAVSSVSADDQPLGLEGRASSRAVGRDAVRLAGAGDCPHREAVPGGHVLIS